MRVTSLTQQQQAAAPALSPKCGQRRSSVTSNSTTTSSCSSRSLSTFASESNPSQFSGSARQHRPLGDLSCNAKWSPTPDVPRLIVRVKGRNEEPFRVPLQPILTRVGGADEEPVLKDAESGLQFLEYLSQEVCEPVTALYYRARVGHGSLEYVLFDGRLNPFVGGMEVVACVNGDNAPPESAEQNGCSVM